MTISEKDFCIIIDGLEAQIQILRMKIKELSEHLKSAQTFERIYKEQVEASKKETLEFLKERKLEDKQNIQQTKQT